MTGVDVAPLPRQERIRRWVREHLRDPLIWTENIQVVKTAVAAVVAWVIAADVLELPQPFLAPWAALLVVHATVYRTFSRGVKQVAATVIGVVLAWATGSLLGVGPLALGVMLVAALVVGHLTFLSAENTTIAATALVVLTTGDSNENSLLFLRLVGTGVGVGVGLAVNFAVWPPFRDRTAARVIDRIDDDFGAMMCEIATALRRDADQEEVRSWVKRTEELDEDIDQAWASVRQARESGRFNPRRRAGVVRRVGQFDEVLYRLEQSVADVRSMARTLDHSVTDVVAWDHSFRDEWLDLLEETGLAVGAADSNRLATVRDRLRSLSERLSTEDLPGQHWPEYGALITNLRNVVTSMDVVADSNPVTPTRMHRPAPARPPTDK